MRLGFVVFVFALALVAGLALSGCLQQGAPSKQAAPVLSAANASSAAPVLPSQAALSVSPSAKLSEKCTLMKNADDVVGCFGCSNGICNNPSEGFGEYVLPSDYIGILYACFATEKGCELAQ